MSNRINYTIPTNLDSGHLFSFIVQTDFPQKDVCLTEVIVYLQEMEANCSQCSLGNIFQNPWCKFRYTSAYTGQVGFSTSNAPRDNPSKEIMSIFSFNLRSHFKIKT